MKTAEQVFWDAHNEWDINGKEEFCKVLAVHVRKYASEVTQDALNRASQMDRMADQLNNPEYERGKKDAANIRSTEIITP